MTFPTTHPALARALAARGYETPTAVQLAVLDAGAAGRDLLVSAQTGSGKTVAFGLALGATLLGGEQWLPPATAPLALIVAPTRELAMQVCRELSWLYEAAGARVVTCVGGMDARAEARQLDAGAHIVVGTPGRLRDHLERRRLDLSGLGAVVLDEADEMLDLGFREDLEFILEATPAERRTLLFSATVPREIEALAGRYQRDAVRVETGRRDEQHADIEYLAHRVVPHDVENTVVNVLRFHEARAALVFCATREAVNHLNARLIERGFSSVALSGELTQHERTQALQALRDGRARVLVATDVAARGLDLPDLALVVHAELPNDGETLLHRSGRTGRAGRKGLCVLIVPFNRRRKADAVIGAARLKVAWRPAPTPEEILAKDQERFLADASFTAPPADGEADLARAVQAVHPAEAIALALIRLHRAKLPAPEDLAVDTGPPPRREWQPRAGQQRGDRFRKDWKRDDARSTPEGFEPRRRDEPQPPQSDATPPLPRREELPPRLRRKDTRPMTWFRINIGRDRNADPRWLLPLICRAGGVTKSEIGAIRVDDRETRFQIVTAVADQFDHAARTAKKKEGQIIRIGQDADAGAGEIATPGKTTPASVPPAGERTERKPEMKKDKSRWRTRGKGKGDAGGWPLRRREGTKSGPHGGQAAAHHGKPASKYAKKKKHRPPAPAAE
jgi:ATP-dependent RNA helicase DeaD